MSRLNKFTLAYVKSKLQPSLTIGRRLGGILEALLPRTMVIARLEADHGVEVLNQKKGHYKSSGDGSFFLIKDVLDFSQGGWFYFEAAMTINNGARKSKLYFVNSHGHETPVPICSNLRGTIREVLYIPKGTMLLKWSPTNGYGFFSQTPFLLSRISVFESYLRRVARVGFDAWRFRVSLGSWVSLKWFFFSLWDINKGYQQSANFRIERIVQRDFKDFVAKHNNWTKREKRSAIAQMKNWYQSTTFVICVEVFLEGEVDRLKFTLKSIQAQLYPMWQCILFVAPDLLKQVSVITSEYKHPIDLCVVEPAEFSHGALLDNILTRSSQPTWLINMRSGDRLDSKALFMFAQEIAYNPNAHIIYSDSDGINQKGERVSPNFKPDWNEDLLFAYDYIGYACAYSLSALKEARKVCAVGCRSYGYLFQLQLMKLHGCEFKASHIPKLLYHVHVSDSKSVDWAISGRIRSYEDGQNLLNKFFSGRAQVNVGYQGKVYRINYALPNPEPFVSIVIPTRDQSAVLKECVNSILQKTTYSSYEIIIVDNGSVEAETLSFFEQIVQLYAKIQILRIDVPFNYSFLNNQAVKVCRGEIVVLLNNDIEVITTDWLSLLVRNACRPMVGAVGAKLLYPDGVVQHAGVIIGIGGVAGHGNKYIHHSEPGYAYRSVVTHGVSAVTGACLAVRKSIYKEVGGLDESLAVAFNDVDFCLKIREAGYQNLFVAEVILTHHESISRGHDDNRKKQELFSKEFEYMKSKWGDHLQADPAYNINLTMQFENFSWN